MSTVLVRSKVVARPAPKCWVVEKGTEGSARMFCFHPAGGAASLFRGWSKQLRGVSTWALQMPGREARFKEAPHRTMQAAVAEIVDSFSEPLTKNDAFFGYSMGGLIALETLRELRRRGKSLPGKFIAAASPSPRIRCVRDPLVSTSPDSTIIDEIRQSKLVPEMILRDMDIMRSVMPTIRADFELLENFQPRQEEPLPISIVAYGALSDQHVKASEVVDWSGETKGNFRLRFFPGDHYFLKSVLEEVFDDVTVELGLPRRAMRQAG